jgi:hypothetical protein
MASVLNCATATALTSTVRHTRVKNLFIRTTLLVIDVDSDIAWFAEKGAT